MIWGDMITSELHEMTLTGTEKTSRWIKYLEAVKTTVKARNNGLIKVERMEEKANFRTQVRSRSINRSTSGDSR